jgi:hypothetical protein
MKWKFVSDLIRARFGCVSEPLPRLGGPCATAFFNFLFSLRPIKPCPHSLTKNATTPCRCAARSLRIPAHTRGLTFVVRLFVSIVSRSVCPILPTRSDGRVFTLASPSPASGLRDKKHAKATQPQKKMAPETNLKSQIHSLRHVIPLLLPFSRDQF